MEVTHLALPPGLGEGGKRGREGREGGREEGEGGDGGREGREGGREGTEGRRENTPFALCTCMCVSMYLSVNQ